MLTLVGIVIVILIQHSTDKPIPDSMLLQKCNTFEQKHNVEGLNNIIILLDFSGSTIVYGINQIIANTTKDLLEDQLPDGITVGLIEIGNYKVIQNMTKLKNKQQRKEISDKINAKNYGKDGTLLEGIAFAIMSEMTKGEGLILYLSDARGELEQEAEGYEKEILELCEMKWNVANIVFSKVDEPSKVRILACEKNNSLSIMHECMESKSSGLLKDIMHALSYKWGKNNTSTEVYPPGFIHNLEGSVTNCSSVDYPQGIVIFWTTTGESLDSGKALEMELHFDTKMSSLIIDGIKHQMDTEEETFPHAFGGNAPGQKQEHHICFPKKLQGQRICLQLRSALHFTAVSNPICVQLSTTPDSESNYFNYYYLLIAVFVILILIIGYFIHLKKPKSVCCCSRQTSQNQCDDVANYNAVSETVKLNERRN